jgi:hypothetical protein
VEVPRAQLLYLSVKTFHKILKNDDFSRFFADVIKNGKTCFFRAEQSHIVVIQIPLLHETFFQQQLGNVGYQLVFVSGCVSQSVNFSQLFENFVKFFLFLFVCQLRERKTFEVFGWSVKCWRR